MMNRNEVIGTLIAKTLGYAAQGLVYSKIAEGLNPQSAILLKTGTQYGIKLIKWTSKNYVRTDFKSETIFSDAIDASFFAY
jgi:hypothetical protein